MAQRAGGEKDGLSSGIGRGSASMIDESVWTTDAS